MLEGHMIREGAMKALLGQFALDARGTTAIEYGLIGALVFLGLIVGVNAYGTSFNGLFNTVETAVVNATSRDDG
jgi:pilus assembly protein Flp/PilA